MTTTSKKLRRMARPASDAESAGSTAPTQPTAPAAPVKRTTKQDSVLALLRAEGGAPLSAIVEATGWLPQTARAALTGLRKKSHAIVRTKLEGETRYTIVATAAE